MAELIVVAFDDPYEADRMLTELTRLQREHLVDLEDAVVTVRGPDGKVRIKQSVNLVGQGAASGAAFGSMWGALIGLLLLNPLAGLVVGGAVGAGTGALSGKAVDYGINDDFIRELANQLEPDRSALFVLVRKAQPEKVLAELSKLRGGKVLRSSLSPAQEARLQAALNGGGTAAGDPTGGGAATQAPAPA